ncbi:hypothetical protein Anas_06470 [Armadillidium nasatum]|uniref:Uncharacterized protein n=1 Tax=Armadillidium nasatum TaxID=96803 RepID=A0A5N5SZ14_9CRUS|nr:hypothetical protein Anas_06470 [Armadillidium nasatum]
MKYINLTLSVLRLKVSFLFSSKLTSSIIFCLGSTESVSSSTSVVMSNSAESVSSSTSVPMSSSTESVSSFIAVPLSDTYEPELPSANLTMSRIKCNKEDKCSEFSLNVALESNEKNPDNEDNIDPLDEQTNRLNNLTEEGKENPTLVQNSDVNSLLDLTENTTSVISETEEIVISETDDYKTKRKVTISMSTIGAIILVALVVVAVVFYINRQRSERNSGRPVTPRQSSHSSIQIDQVNEEAVNDDDWPQGSIHIPRVPIRRNNLDIAGPSREGNRGS